MVKYIGSDAKHVDTPEIALCKQENGKNFVRFGLRGEMYNPHGLFETNPNKMLSARGKPAWEFRRVSDKVFKYYLKFLQTRNVSWLRNAERMLRGGE